jgi:poly(3-hydroxybutyrate) depolymerase
MRGLVFAMLIGCAVPAAADERVVKETLGFDEKLRTYYLFVPDKAKGGSAPLLVLLHGSGRDGRSLIDPWKSLASKEGIILVAPDSTNREGWHMLTDGPDFLYALVETVRTQHDADPRRMYLFGHSAGAVHGLAMAILESEYFASAAVHAGILQDEYVPFVSRAPRKIPIGMWVGTNDALFPLPPVRGTRDTLKNAGFDVDLTEIPRHTHRYYDRAGEINKSVWAFLQKTRLSDEPRYQLYAK